jgi:hypothetical protein
MIAIAVVIAANNATSTKKVSINCTPFLAWFKHNYQSAAQKLVKGWVLAVKFESWVSETCWPIALIRRGFDFSPKIQGKSKE